MNAKQRKLMRMLVNDLLKRNGAKIVVTPAKGVNGDLVINFKFEGIEFDQAMALISQIPEGLDFDRIS